MSEFIKINLMRIWQISKFNFNHILQYKYNVMLSISDTAGRLINSLRRLNQNYIWESLDS